jgi:hypothetical protein
MQLLTPELSINSVIWISSFPEYEAGIVGRMIESMEAISQELSFGFQQITVSGSDELFKLIDELACLARDEKMLPLLHFDMHGKAKEGLHISASDEFVSWALSGDIGKMIITFRCYEQFRCSFF